jgi:dihydrofolate reductase
MTKLKVHNFSISLDGYGCGPDQSVENPLGIDGERLHDWLVSTRFFHEMIGEPGGEEGVNNDYARRWESNFGATIMGRNMFGPIRGPWKDESWTGWWGENPPYHHPVFVLTHYPRPSQPMKGGTTFHFVTEGIEAALERAAEAAQGSDVRLGGGAGTIQQYLNAGLLDEMHVAIVPILLGGGERLLDHLEGAAKDLQCVELVSSGSVVHVRLARQP